MSLAFQNIPVQAPPGVMPEPDATPQSTPYWTAGEAIYFDRGRLRSKNGRAAVTVDGSLEGCIRNVFSFIEGNGSHYILGGNENLYDLMGGTAVNITPVVATTVPVVDGLNTNYATLANNPITTVSGSGIITINYAAITDDQLRAGDSITLSGAATTNGILNTTLNAAHTLATVNTAANTATIVTSGTANASSAGGGASVVLTTSLVGVTKASHGIPDGKRIKVLAAADTGGILAATLNVEAVIRLESANKFSYSVATKATSAVSGGGGVSTTYQVQIADGECDVTAAYGYGGGYYGLGLYGDSQAFQTPAYPRLWWIARFGNSTILTPGNQTGVYKWEDSTVTAPVALTNAPTACNGLIVDGNQILAWGVANVGNRLAACDTGDDDDWTPAADSEAWTDDIEGADEFISAARCNGVVILFTRTQAWRHRYVGKPKIRITEQLAAPEGLIAPKAVVSVNNQCFYMGKNDFYVTDGNTVKAIPSTMRRYVFEDIDDTQIWKAFAWYDPVINTVEFHYLSFGAEEPDRVARYSLTDGTWVPDVSDLTAAEVQGHITAHPLGVADADVNHVYQLEYGNNDGSSAQAAYAETNYFQLGQGDRTFYIMRFYPDATATGNYTVTIYTKLRAEDSDIKTSGPHTITPTTSVVNFRIHGRLAKVKIAKTAVDTAFTVGLPQLGIQEAGWR